MAAPPPDDEDVRRLLFDGKELDADVTARVEAAELSRTMEGAATLTVSVRDPDRALVRSRLFTERVRVNLDGRLFELVGVGKSGSTVTGTFEDATVADLRRARGVLSAKPGTAVDAFARRLVSASPGAKLVAESGRRSLVTLTRGAGDSKSESSWEALTRLAEERRWRVVVDGHVVLFGSDAWLARRVPKLVVREHEGGVGDVDYDLDAGKLAQEATLDADATRWAAPPGTPVEVLEQGLASGVWLVHEVRRSLFSKRTRVTLHRGEVALPEPKPEPRDDGGTTTAGKADAGGKATAGPVSSKGYAWPLSGTMTSGYGQRGGRLHAGVDLACPVGTPVGAARDGTVLFAGDASGYGVAVYLDHGGGHITRYGHLSKLLVRRGQRVALGDRLALSGNTGRSTGPHLHLELRVNGSAVNPLPYLPPRR